MHKIGFYLGMLSFFLEMDKEPLNNVVLFPTMPLFVLLVFAFSSAGCKSGHFLSCLH